jgi:hypothetical protein
MFDALQLLLALVVFKEEQNEHLAVHLLSMLPSYYKYI